MDLCLQQGTFDAVRDAALALKTLGRWDLVLDACMKCFQHVWEHDQAFVRREDVRPGDDFPFRWLFPANGFKKGLNRQQEKLLAETRAKLFGELRRLLDLYEKATLLKTVPSPSSSPTKDSLAAKKKKKTTTTNAEDYSERLGEISRAYVQALRECSKTFELAKTYASTQSSSETLRMIEKADGVCLQLLGILRMVNSSPINLDSLVKHIEEILDFKQAVTEKMRYVQPPKKRSRADVEEIERMASQIAAKIQRTKK